MTGVWPPLRSSMASPYLYWLHSRGRLFAKGHLWPRETASFARALSPKCSGLASSSGTPKASTASSSRRNLVTRDFRATTGHVSLHLSKIEGSPLLARLEILHGGSGCAWRKTRKTAARPRKTKLISPSEVASRVLLSDFTPRCSQLGQNAALLFRAGFLRQTTAFLCKFPKLLRVFHRGINRTLRLGVPDCMSVMRGEPDTGSHLPCFASVSSLTRRTFTNG